MDSTTQKAGRPAITADLPKEMLNFKSGLDLYYDSMAGDFGCYFAINTRCKEGRTLDKRDGFTRKGNDGAAGVVQMEGSLQISNGVDIQLRIVNGATGVILQSFDYVGNTWVNVDAEFGNSSSKVDFFGDTVIIGGEERFYFGNGVDQLRYTDGVNIFTVSNGGTAIQCKFVTVVENILIGGNWFGTHNRNEIVYCKAGTDQFFKDVDLVLADSSNKITFDAEVTGCRVFGWLLYVYTGTNGLWEVDLSTGIPRKISTHGTLSPKSIAIGHEVMIWADQYSFWKKELGGDIQRIGEPIEKFYKTISASNIAQLAGGISPEGLYKCWIGTATFEGDSFANSVVIYDIERSRVENNKIWGIDTNKPANCWTNWTNQNGFTNDYFGSRVQNNTFIDDSGTSDNGDDITLDWRSHDVVMADEKQEVVFKEITNKIQPQSSTFSFSVYKRMDTAQDDDTIGWDLLKTITIPVGTQLMKMFRLMAGKGSSGRTLGIRFVVTGQVPFKLYEGVFYYNLQPSEIRAS